MDLHKRIFNGSRKLSEVIKDKGVTIGGLLVFIAIAAFVAPNQDIVHASNTYGYPEKSTYGYPQYQNFGYPKRSNSTEIENSRKGDCIQKCNVDSNDSRRSCYNEFKQDGKCQNTQALGANDCKYKCKSKSKENLNSVQPNEEFRKNDYKTSYQKSSDTYANREKYSSDMSITEANSKTHANKIQSETPRSEALQENIIDTEVVDSSSVSPVAYRPTSSITELPQTGTQDSFMHSLGAGSLAAALYAYIRSRRAMSNSPSSY